MVEANTEEMPSSNGLDWDKLFKMAEDLDLDEVTRGPIENALVHLAKSPENIPKIAKMHEKNFHKTIENKGGLAPLTPSSF
ncbi:unnamed protein product [Strongylus vulgaris]|uniref:Uncharacterized protein n=1 Tax=Strongylus vulgaris TaxID=40348 RepID=A0A3P7L269_STRVU|nr:unnamed protein product [Strongylus vulgaris]